MAETKGEGAPQAETPTRKPKPKGPQAASPSPPPAVDVIALAERLYVRAVGSTGSQSLKPSHIAETAFKQARAFAGVAQRFAQRQ